MADLREARVVGRVTVCVPISVTELDVEHPPPGHTRRRCLRVAYDQLPATVNRPIINARRGR